MQTPRSFLKAVLLGAILLTGAHPAIAALKPFAVYDPNGNLTSRCEGTGVTRTGTACTGSTVTSLAYNALDQLTQAAKTGQDTQTYRYDDQGRRVAKLVGGTVNKQYLYNGEDIYGVYTNWTTPAALYTHGPNTDDPLIRQTASGAQYYHADGLGSIVAMTSSPAGNAIYGLARYDVWGNVTGTLVAPIPAYGYTGREPDETGLIYYRARYYDPTIGRFTQRDPIGLQGGLNQYAYTNNNPVNLTDPSGNLPKSPITFWDESNRSYVLTITYTHISSGSQSLASMSAGGASGIAKTAWDVASAFVPGSGVVDAYNAFSQGDYFLGVVALATEIPVLKGLKAEEKLAGAVEREGARGVDFAGSPALYAANPGQSNIVKIQYTGTRDRDFLAANVAAGFGSTQKPPSGYTWHHLDDYDPITNTGTMQLVTRLAHEASYPHYGGVAQYVKATGIPYDLSDAARANIRAAGIYIPGL